jgi:hypothetical protein
VCATPTPALAGHRLRVYPGNRVLVLCEEGRRRPARARSRCQLARTFAVRSMADEPLAPQVLADRVERLREVIEQAAEIRGGVLEARRGVSRISDAYEAMRTDALAVLDNLDAQLR